MNAAEDKGLSKESKKGLYVFLEAERLRHEDDIRKIRKTQRKLEVELGLSFGNYIELNTQAEKYREF